MEVCESAENILATQFLINAINAVNPLLEQLRELCTHLEIITLQCLLEKRNRETDGVCYTQFTDAGK